MTKYVCKQTVDLNMEQNNIHQRETKLTINDIQIYVNKFELNSMAYITYSLW